MVDVSAARLCVLVLWVRKTHDPVRVKMEETAAQQPQSCPTISGSMARLRRLHASVTLA